LIDIVITVCSWRRAQVEFSDDVELTNGHIYAVADFDMFVIVKYLQVPLPSRTCTCPPVMQLFRSMCLE